MNKAIPPVLLRYIDGLTRHDVAQISGTVGADAAIILPTGTLQKPDFLAFLRSLYLAFPDWHYDHDAPESLGPAGTFGVRWRQSGTHTAAFVLADGTALAASGKAVRIPEQQFFYRVVNDQLIEIRPDPIPGGAPWGIREQIES